MPILVEQKHSFKLMPEGLHQAVVSEVKDLGEQTTQYGTKRSIAVRLVNAKGEEATRFYTPSLNEKSKLAKDLIALRGSIPAKFDIESLVGTQLQVLTTTGMTSKGLPTAKVEKILKPVAGQDVKFTKRPGANPIVNDHGLTISDDDLPDFA